MTPQQRDALNRFLAERVMGKQGEALLVDYVSDWNTCQYLLDKIEQDGFLWTWGNNDDNGYRFMVWANGRHGTTWSKDCRTEALCLAIARAYGWKEDV